MQNIDLQGKLLFICNGTQTSTSTNVTRYKTCCSFNQPFIE
ncbi:unnamed protein product, partial [Rotaria sp. Silwood1]